MNNSPGTFLARVIKDSQNAGKITYIPATIVNAGDLEFKAGTCINIRVNSDCHFKAPQELEVKYTRAGSDQLSHYCEAESVRAVA